MPIPCHEILLSPPWSYMPLVNTYAYIYIYNSIVSIMYQIMYGSYMFYDILSRLHCQHHDGTYRVIDQSYLQLNNQEWFVSYNRIEVHTDVITII